ncbi:hypothetical protein WMY93_019938 [Mugilogobius chulae]|uniref:Uncharacterized protein n=1 Tax=Mugilogobius chulae TaxID=88201 RepID=A0AAW0NFP8_9GOBI
MKTSRATTAPSSVQGEDDCGVWIDTEKLKRKVQKKRSARPISKLLNPFTDGAGYNVAVALNFTQTKMEMPKTKQSSISNFFTCQRRVLNKMSTSGNPNAGTLEASSTTQDSKSDLSNEPLWSNEDYNHENNEPEAAMWWNLKDEECKLSSPPNIHSDDEEEGAVRAVCTIITSQIFLAAVLLRMDLMQV